MSFAENVRQQFRTIRETLQKLEQRSAAIAAQHQLIKKMMPPPSITQEIDAIPGRRLFYNLGAVGTFTAADNGQRGQPLNALVSQDGPFVMTHYPHVLWRPSAPANATNFGLWRPVSAYPLPDQATPAGGAFDLDEDIISISYDVVDTGSQRNFQNLPAGPILSRPDNLIPLPVPTLLTPNTTVQFIPTFNSIRFTAAVPPTEGTMLVTFPGYRIANM